MEQETRNCQNCKKDFVIEPEDFDFYKRIDVPPPTWCPDCRMMRRMLFWNEHNFFKKLEKRTGKEIISMYPPESSGEIYERDFWWSDGWDPFQYGRDIDFSRPFFSQLGELLREVPAAARSIAQSVNSDYSNNASDLKNCYLCFNADMCEDSMYSVGINRLKNCLDIFRGDSSELCYDSFGIFNSYQCFYSVIGMDNRNVSLSYNCVDCSDCFGCVNLRHKQYHIFNVSYTREEYFAKLKEINLGSYKVLKEMERKFTELNLKFPRKFMTGIQNQNVTGDYIKHSKNTKASYSLSHSENVKYSQSILMGAKDTYDYTNWGSNVELAYETKDCGGNIQGVKFSIEVFDGCNDVEYSVRCISSSNLFGCNGLRNKQYCILNKQYSKEEYEALVPKIRQHMLDMPYVDAKGRVYTYGEFFPLEFSSFAANDSAIVDFMEFDKQKAGEYGLVWREANSKDYQTTMQSADIPDHINDVADDILKEVIACGVCGKGYRIVSGELEFLRRFNLSLPRECFNCRHSRRVNFRNKPRYFDGSCQCAGSNSTNGLYANVGVHPHGAEACQNKFRTSYAPDRPEIVYCEQCYQQEVV